MIFKQVRRRGEELIKYEYGSERITFTFERFTEVDNGCWDTKFSRLNHYD